MRNFFDTYYATSKLPNKIPNYNIDNSEKYFNEYINCHSEIEDDSQFVVDELKETIEKQDCFALHSKIEDNSQFIVDKLEETVAKVDYLLDLPTGIMKYIYSILDKPEVVNLSKTSKFNNDMFWQAKLDEIYGIDISQQKQILKENESPRDLFKSISIAFKGAALFIIKFQIADFKFLIQQYITEGNEYTFQEVLNLLKEIYEECPTSPGLLYSGIIGINSPAYLIKERATNKNLCIRTLMISEKLNREDAECAYDNIDNKFRGCIAKGLSRIKIEEGFPIDLL